VQTQEKDAVAHGKKPYFLKKSEKKKLELLAKYEELKSSGRLEKYMAKRRKKNAAKDHRYLPTSRQTVGQE
jgi:ribosomal RNA-processing protein 36